MLKKSPDQIQAANSALQQSSDGLVSQITIYQKDLELKEQQIKNLEKEVERVRLYTIYANFTIYGRKIDVGGSLTGRNTPLSDLMAQLLVTGPDQLTYPVNDLSKMPIAERVIKEYPEWPYGYYVKMFILKTNQQSWKAMGKQAEEKIRMLTFITGHEIVHDKTLEIVKRHLAMPGN
jgi:hypothetical protein